MKKILFGTTALVAAGLVAGQASASEKIKLGLGGYFNWGVGFTSEDDGTNEPANNTHSNAMGKQAEVKFSGSTTLDNGMTAGVVMEIRHETGSTSNADYNYIWFEGGFGKILLGNHLPASNTMHNGVPNAFLGRSIVDDGSGPFAYTHAASGNVYDGSMAWKSSIGGKTVNKLTYQTPQVAGLQLGVSWTPVVGTDPKNSTPSDNRTNAWEDALEAAVKYSGEFGGVSVAATASYSKADLERDGGATSSNVDDRGATLSAKVGMGNISAGAFYSEQINRSNKGYKQQNWGLGAAYKMDALTVSAGYSRETHEQEATPGVSDDELTGYEIGASYALGPGVDVMAGYQVVDIDDGHDAAEDNTANIIHIGTKLSF